MTANLFSGSGASLTNLNASNLSNGTVASARLPLATTSAVGAVAAPNCATGTHYSGVDGSGNLACSTDAVTTSLGFNSINTGTNTSATMTVSSGASLAPAGTGTITGQAFLKTRGGEVRFGAGNMVLLIPSTPYTEEDYVRAVVNNETLKEPTHDELVTLALRG